MSELAHDFDVVNQRLNQDTNLEIKKDYIVRNTDTCKKCGIRGFWVSTARGKRVLMDFPNQILIPKDKLTHELVWSAKDGIYTGHVEAWPSSQATHSVHFDTCDGRK